MEYCASMGLYVRISEEHSETSPNFLHKLPVAVARSSSGCIAIHCILMAVCMTSRFPYDGPRGCVMLQSDPAAVCVTF